MMLSIRFRNCRTLIILAILGCLGLYPVIADADKISEPGEYSGYSEPIYSGYVLSSEYVPGHDGTLLAVDIYRPSNDGVTAVETPWPAVLITPPYVPLVRRTAKIIYMNRVGAGTNLIKHGYVVVAMDPRGFGASFGARKGDFSLDERLDGRAVIEWIANQAWCSGQVAGMGMSYMGTSQLAITSTQPDPLLAITPQVAAFDNYSQFYPNGVTAIPIGGQQELNLRGIRVDEDADGSMAAAARREHANGISNAQIHLPGLFRDDYNEATGNRPFIDNSNITHSDAIEASNVAIYQFAAWFDHHPDEQLVAFKRLGHKILIGPWVHGIGNNKLIGVEHHRWFDHILKGIDNGIMDEPPIYYYTTNAPKGKEWRYGPAWPLPSQSPTHFYFNGNTSGSVASVNDGGLSVQQPMGEQARDDYTVDYSVTVFNGKYDRSYRSWSGDMTASPDEKGLTYTTDPLENDTQVTGHPVVELWVTSTAPDGYFLAYLEEVDADGFSRYVSDGVMRASFRKIDQDSPWYDVGIPYHRGFEEDYAPLSNQQPVLVAFHMFPVSYVFAKGSRIRITITCSDEATYPFPEGMKYDPAPVIGLYRDQQYPSRITLPIIDDLPEKFKGMLRVKSDEDDGGRYAGWAELYAFKSDVYLHYNGQWRHWKTVGVEETDDGADFKCEGDLGPISVTVKTPPDKTARAVAVGAKVFFSGNAR